VSSSISVLERKSNGIDCKYVWAAFIKLIKPTRWEPSKLLRPQANWMYAAATLWMNDYACEDEVHTVMLEEIQVLCIYTKLSATWRWVV
jgi:hypothetical protein